jgi:hypothetical protein
MASLNLSGNNNNYYKIQAGDTEGSWVLTLPSQNDTLATLKDVELLGSPWTFKGTTSITGAAPQGAVQGDAWVNKTAGQPDASWDGLAPSRIIPVDALIVYDASNLWHELSSSEIDPIFQASPAYGISVENITAWDTAVDWGDHSVVGYLTEESANNLGYDEYGKSVWSEADTIAKIPNWDDAYKWGDHDLVGYLVEELDPVFLASPAGKIVDQDILNWNQAFDWDNHATQGYLKEVETLNSIGDVNAPTPKTDEVLTAVRDNDGNVNWISKKVNVIVEGELLFKGPVDATKEGPKEEAQVGHLYVNTYDPDNPYEENDTTGQWGNVTKVKYGDKLAFGDDNDWHVIGNAGIGTDLSSFSVVNDSTNPVEGGNLSYDSDTGVFTYTTTDAYTQAETLEKLSKKADKDKVYLKTETYSQVEVDGLLKDKANAGDSYTKAEADAMIQEIRQNEVVFLNSNTVDERGITIKDGWNGVSAGPIFQNGEVDLQGDAAWTITGGGSGGAVDTSVFDLEATPMYAELKAVKKKADKVAALEEEVQELKGMVKQLIKGIK